MTTTNLYPSTATTTTTMMTNLVPAKSDATTFDRHQAVGSTVRGSSTATTSSDDHTTPRLLKENIKKDRNNNNNSIGRAGEFRVVEPGICAPFELVGIQDRRQSSLTDDACKTNSCFDGCCRVYNWLICDTTNAYHHLQCVCNTNTGNYVPPPPTTTSAPVPTTPPTTPKPTISPQPTKAPTPPP